MSAKKQPTLADMSELIKAAELGLIGDVILFIRKYAVMTPAQLMLLALWVQHTHAVGCAEQTPYPIITSPEKQCGKTRLMETLALLVARPWLSITPSEAVVYRYIDAKMPTMLLDEADTVFSPRQADKHEGLRAIINAGNRRGAKVPRAVGTSEEIAMYDAYSAKALAGIGTLPDTVTDRGFPIRLQRKDKTEKVKRMRRREAEPLGKALQGDLAESAEDNSAALARATPVMPGALSDRMQDATECLMAIARKMGGACPALAREALIELCTGERVDDTNSMRLRLLADIRAIFEENGRRSMTTETLITALVAVEESPWGHYGGGRLIEPRDLAALLRQYGVRSKNLALPSGKRPKGYTRDQLQPVWERYTQVTDDDIQFTEGDKG
jgi:hypothetical protein